MTDPAEIEQWRSSLNQLARETIQLGEDLAQVQEKLDGVNRRRAELWQEIDKALDEPIEDK